MKWIFLLIAGIFEIGRAVGLKINVGFTKPIASTFTVIGIVVSYYFLLLVLKNLPLGIAYSIWTGIWVVEIVIFGIFLFDEPVTIMEFICIFMTLFGIAGFKLLAT